MSTDQELRVRAKRVIPGGMFGHLNANRLPAGYPQFYQRGQGCHIWDADGRRYVDFMCSWGPIILGHQHPEVTEAVQKQMRDGDCLNGPSERMVELAERLVRLIPHAEWAVFSKNGTDATTTCVTLARAGTKRRKILVAAGAYHGAIPWCALNEEGTTAEDRAHLLTYAYNDVGSLETAVQRAGDDLAGVIVSAFRHDYGKDQELPDPVFARRVRELCDATGAAMIVDDVRRLPTDPARLVGSRRRAARPQRLEQGDRQRLRVAAVTGNGRFPRRRGEGVSHRLVLVQRGVDGRRAGDARRVERIDGPAIMRAMGTRLREGIATQAREFGVGVRQSGPPQMPTLLFDNDPDCAKGERFTQATPTHGVFLHPKHNMFLSTAHTAEDIDFALAATRKGFAALAAR